MAPPDPLADAFRRLAALAPTLREAELRVCLALAALHARQPGAPVPASSRSLSSLTRLARSAVVAALDSLAARGLLGEIRGSTSRPAAYSLLWLETLEMPPQPGGPPTGPPQDSQNSVPVLFEDQPGLPAGPGVVLQQDQGGPFAGPPPTGNKGLPPAVDIDNDLLPIQIIDRLLTANPKNTPPADLANARRWLHGYRLKLGREPRVHPPDDRILAQFLSIAPWPALERLLYDLLAERKEPGYSYAWFVSVALQRLHGLEPARYARLRDQRRAELKLVKAPQAAPEPEPDPQWSQALAARATASVRSF